MTRRALMLHLLRQAGDRGLTTAELLQGGVGSRYGARLMELREQGHCIEAERVRDGSWRYTLTHDAEREVGAAATASGVSLGADPYPAPQAGQPGGHSAPPHAPPRTAAPPSLFSLPDPEGEGPGEDFETPGCDDRGMPF